MALIYDMQKDILDNKTNISNALRKCKVLAFKIKSEELKNWVDRELNGYGGKDDLPEYRIFSVQSKGDFIGVGKELKNGNIPLSCIPEKFREDFSKVYCCQPISAYEALLSVSEGKNIIEEWPHDFTASVAGKIYQNMNCFAAWKVIPYVAIVSLIDSVKNRLLNFILEMEAENPSIGSIEVGSESKVNKKANEAVQTIIYGNVGNISNNGSNVNQTAIINVTKDDFSSLENQLEEYGIPKNEIKELKNEIRKDNKKYVIKKKTLGTNVKSWIKKITKTTLPVVQSVTANMLTKAISLYYGIDS